MTILPLIPETVEKEKACERRRLQARVLPSALYVQQPCSNPSDYPEILRKPSDRRMYSFAGNLQYREMLGNLLKETLNL